MTDEGERDQQGLKPTMVSGSLWMFCVNLVRRGLGIISTIILARLLPPSDFGLVAMATVLMALVMVFTEFGFDIALIQSRNAKEVHYDTAWTFNVMLGVGSALLLMLMAWPAAEFYDEPKVLQIVLVLSLAVVFRGFQNIGVVDFRKHLRFRREFYFHAGAKVGAFVVTIGFAVATRSYWALVIGTLAWHLVLLVLSYALHPYRPRFSLKARRELFAFSIWMFLNNLLFYVRTRGANLIIGRLLGAHSLGLFIISQEIAFLPSEQVVGPVNRAILPGYAKISHDRQRFGAAYLNVMAVIALLIFPVAVGIAAVSEFAVPLLLGERWLAAIPLIQALAIVALITALQANTVAAYFAMGKPSLQVYLQSFTVVLLVPSAIVLIEWFGLIGIAYAYLGVNGLMFLASCAVAMRQIGITASALAGSMTRPLLAAALMYAAIAWGQQNLLAGASPFTGLIASIALGAAVFISATVALWLAAGRPSGAETFVLDYVERVPLLRKALPRVGS